MHFQDSASNGQSTTVLFIEAAKRNVEIEAAKRNSNPTMIQKLIEVSPLSASSFLFGILDVQTYSGFSGRPHRELEVGPRR